MSTRQDLKRYRANLQGEVDAITLYLAMAQAETQPQVAEIYRRLATVEEKHAKLWEDKLREAGAFVPLRKPTVNARIKVWLSQRLGPNAVLPMMAATERADRG